MAHRGNILSLYDNILEQSGSKSVNGGKSVNGDKSVNVGKGAKNSSTIDSYSPSDMSLNDQSSVAKLMKANRELKRDLDVVQDELKKVKKELEQAKSMLTKYGK